MCRQGFALQGVAMRGVAPHVRPSRIARMLEPAYRLSRTNTRSGDLDVHGHGERISTHIGGHRAAQTHAQTHRSHRSTGLLTEHLSPHGFETGASSETVVEGTN